EVLRHRDARVGGQELKGRLLGGGRDDHRRVVHGAVLAKLVDDLRDRGGLLADGDIEAVNALALLIDDRVDRDGGLAGLAVADDELALTAADRDHRIDGLDARLKRLLDGLTRHDSGRLDLDLTILLRAKLALAVDRKTKGVHHATEKLLADRHL